MQVSNSSVVATKAEPDASAASGNRTFVAFVADETSEAALRAALVGPGSDADIRRGDIRNAIRFLAKDAAPHALLVDIEGVQDPNTALDDLARVCPPQVRVIVVGDKTDITFYRTIVHDLGATEYVHKPLTRESIQRLILPHISGTLAPHPGTRGGHIVAVCGARGGVGATTVAINMAFEVARVTSGHVGLLDLHLQGGCTAAMLAARPGPGLRIALEDPDGVDTLFLERAAIAINPRLRLIAAEEGFDAPVSASDNGVATVLDLLRQKFNFVVVDLPMPLPPSMRGVIAMARQVVAVLGPDVLSLRDTKAIQQLVSRSAGVDRVLTVLNRNDMRGGLKPALILKALGAAPDVVIPDLGKSMLEAANLGIPAVQRIPALRRNLVPLVREIAGVEPTRSHRSRLVKVLFG